VLCFFPLWETSFSTHVGIIPQSLFPFQRRTSSLPREVTVFLATFKAPLSPSQPLAERSPIRTSTSSLLGLYACLPSKILAPSLFLEFPYIALACLFFRPIFEPIVLSPSSPRLWSYFFFSISSSPLAVFLRTLIALIPTGSSLVYRFLRAAHRFPSHRLWRLEVNNFSISPARRLPRACEFGKSHGPLAVLVPDSLPPPPFRVTFTVSTNSELSYCSPFPAIVPFVRSALSALLFFPHRSRVFFPS